MTPFARFNTIQRAFCSESPITQLHTHSGCQHSCTRTHRDEAHARVAGGELLTGRSVFGSWKQENDVVLVLQSPLTVDAADVWYSVSAFFFSSFFFSFFFLKHQQGIQKPPTEDQAPVLIDIVCSHRRKVGACRRGRAPPHTGVLKGWKKQKKDFKGLKSLNSGH